MRQIPTANNLVADVEGDIAEVDGVLRITRIHLTFRLEVPAGSQETLDRVRNRFAEKCPAYQSVKDCIACSWDVVATEA